MSSTLTLSGTVNAAKQGWYNSTRKAENIGTIKVTFPSHTQAAGYIIEDVKLYFTFTSSGKSAQKKMSITFTGTNSFKTDLTTKGSANNKKTYVSLSGSNLNNFKNWLAAGGTVITSADPDTSTANSHQENGSPYGWYSDNYAKITTAEVVITYTPSSSTATFSSTNAVLNKTFSLTINSADSSYTHDINIKYNGKTSNVLSGQSGGAKSFTVNGATFGPSFPNSTSMSATLELITKNNGTQIGTTSYAITLMADEAGSGPSISSYSMNTTGAILGGITLMSFTCDATSKFGASIKNYSVKIGNAVANSSSGTITMTAPAGSSTSQNYTITATDSRGFTVSKTGSVYINPYSNPYLTNVSVYRCNSSGVRDDISGTYAKVSYTKNVSLLKDASGNNISPQNSGTVSLIIGGVSREIETNGVVKNATFNVDTSYPVILTITDTVGKKSSTVNAELSSSKYLLHFRKGQNSIGIGCAADNVGTNTGKIKIGLPLELTSTIKLSAPLSLDQGGTGASSRDGAFTNIVSQGGTITGELTTNGALKINGKSLFYNNEITIINSDTAPVLRFQKTGSLYYNGAVYFSGGESLNTLAFRNYNGNNTTFENFLLPKPTVSTGEAKNYNILTTKNYTLNKGTHSFNNVIAFGFLTGGKRQIKLYFPFGIPFDESVSQVSISSLKGNIRCNNVYLSHTGEGSYADGGTEMWNGTQEKTAALRKEQNIIYAYIEPTSAISNATNNTVLQFDGSITFTLS